MEEFLAPLTMLSAAEIWTAWDPGNSTAQQIKLTQIKAVTGNSIHSYAHTSWASLQEVHSSLPETVKLEISILGA